jgi:hypothetical protein
MSWVRFDTYVSGSDRACVAEGEEPETNILRVL